MHAIANALIWIAMRAPWGTALTVALCVWIATTIFALLGGADGGLDLGTPTGWFQGGGLLAFAAVVYRQLERLVAAFTDVGRLLSAVLERLARIDAALDLPAPPPPDRAPTAPPSSQR